MVDLSRPAVHQFWSEYPDPNVYRVIAFMEGVEKWTLDGDPSVENALTEIGSVLEDISKVDLSELGQQELFILIACYIKAARVLRLLQALDTAHPGAASKLLIHAEEVSQGPEDPAGLFLRRNIVFERLRLLSRVFAPNRVSLVLKTLEGEDHA